MYKGYTHFTTDQRAGRPYSLCERNYFTKLEVMALEATGSETFKNLHQISAQQHQEIDLLLKQGIEGHAKSDMVADMAKRMGYKVQDFKAKVREWHGSRETTES